MLGRSTSSDRDLKNASVKFGKRRNPKLQALIPVTELDEGCKFACLYQIEADSS